MLQVTESVNQMEHCHKCIYVLAALLSQTDNLQHVTMHQLKL